MLNSIAARNIQLYHLPRFSNSCREIFVHLQSFLEQLDNLADTPAFNRPLSIITPDFHPKL